MLDFSDTSFADFFASELNVNTNDPKYAANGGSKEKRLRFFLQTCDAAAAVRALTARGSIAPIILLEAAGRTPSSTRSRAIRV